MLELTDFSKCTSTPFGYGGLSGKKRNIILDGHQYMVKFPDNLKEKALKNVKLSYSNGSISEWLGSHIYDICGIPVHETKLGYLDGKLVVACKHIYEPGEYLCSFAELKNTVSENISSSGNGVVIDDVLKSVEALSSLIVNLDKRFWEMFVVDALINNTDRNNGNWSVIFEMENNVPYLKGLAPVYDNGASFNPKWDDTKFKCYLNNEEAIKEMAYKGTVCIFTRDSGRKLNPFKFMEEQNSSSCNEAIEKIVSAFDVDKANKLIEDLLETKLVSEAQAQFYSKTLEMRFEERLIPIFENIQDASLCLKPEN